MISRRQFLRFTGGLGALGASTAAYGFGEPLLRLRVARYNITPKQWPANFQLKIAAIADHALLALEVDAAGLDAMDRRYLTTIAMNYGGGPVGVETMAAALSEPRDAIEDIIEPFLIQCGYLQRTPRGRLLTSHAFRHLGLAEPSRDPAQFGLFGGGEEE